MAGDTLVLLASTIAGSLYGTIAGILQSGWCVLVAKLGQTIPAQSSFFLNYLLQARHLPDTS